MRKPNIETQSQSHTSYSAVRLKERKPKIEAQSQSHSSISTAKRTPFPKPPRKKKKKKVIPFPKPTFTFPAVRNLQLSSDNNLKNT